MVQFVGLLDPHGTVLEINKVALDGVGIELSLVEGRPFWTTFWWQVSDPIRDELRSSIERAAGGEFVRWDTEIFGRAGGTETIVIDASLCPVRDVDGQVVFITAEGRDITEKKAHEREIARQREELARLDVLKTQFFANVSHEFRTPLTLMLGPLEEALANRHGALPLAATRELSVAHRNALRLMKLVNTLLEFSRLEAGRAVPSYESTDLAALTVDLASSFRSLCEKADLTLRVECEPVPQAYVDPSMWEKIVLNLVSNAFKFTREGGIEVRLICADGQAILSVADTGEGIPEDQLPQMFDRFHRIERVRGRTHEGTGIGLALVKELVRLHGGSIELDSELGRGSTFRVRIPLGKAHLEPGRIQRGQPASAESRSQYMVEALHWLPNDSWDEQPVFSERPRVLWADDNADMRGYVSRILGAQFEVQEVSDGEQALQAAREFPPDLILSDVMMPRMDGFALLAAVRSDERLKDVPVILLSARAGEESRSEGVESGADDYLVKPFSARELMARVATNIRVSRQLRAARDEAAALQALADACADPLFCRAADGVVTARNAAAAALLGDGGQVPVGWTPCETPLAGGAMLVRLQRQ